MAMMKFNNKKQGGRPSEPITKGTFSRLIKELWSYYKFRWVLVFLCMFFVVIGNSFASIFIKNITSIITEGLQVGYDSIHAKLIEMLIIMASVYVLSITCSIVMNTTIAVITQGSLKNIRLKMFKKMEKLPIKYFDQNTHGDIMSHYTNDTDSLRQLIGSSLTTVVQSGIMVLVLLGIMLTYSIWLAIIIFLGILSMILVTKKIGANSAKGFMRQQKQVAKLEGYIEETINGQKVVKVFNHENNIKEEFNKINNDLKDAMEFANSNANRMGPIMSNIGNIMYVMLAFFGGLLIVLSMSGPVFNLTITGLKPITIEYFLPIVISFLTLARQFSNNINQLAQQINSIIMALAAADRIYKLVDQPEEVDDGYVTLVNAKLDKNGVISECSERTGVWAWKHPHSDGSITYHQLQGDIRMFDVDFGYVPEKIVLHNVSLYAEPGQKIAFVGATGAGKTTITNLINRFYDIADGKIRYDGININKIKKADLRRSLGIVLQDTNLFTGTVMENIRYGRLDASDEECVEAAKLANAHDFISRLPKGYETELTSDGANLSQGQRQLIAIARAAVADAPVMIMDEATSSIDTRTELLVQDGTDKLMKGRTVFVIAHRLSTVQNSDVIMVLDKGEIIERGSHEQLIEKKGKYYQLYTGAFELE